MCNFCCVLHPWGRNLEPMHEISRRKCTMHCQLLLSAVCLTKTELNVYEKNSSKMGMKTANHRWEGGMRLI